MQRINEITCNGVEFKVGDSVAYADVEVVHDISLREHKILVREPKIVVAKILVMDYSPGWAESDPSVELHLDNDKRINLERVVKVCS